MRTTYVLVENEKIFWSFSEWPFYTGFTVYRFYCNQGAKQQLAKLPMPLALQF